MLIRNLHGLYSQIRYTDDRLTISATQFRIDLALERLGAEPEGVRQARHEAAMTIDAWEDLYAVDVANGHALYEAWLNG